MRRRLFLRAGAAAAFAGPSLLTLPAAAAPRPARRPGSAVPLPIRLASNENPLGLPDAARRAIEVALADGNRYPSLTGNVARAVAQHFGLQPSNVVLGNGSTELLQMAVQLVGQRGGRLVLPDPTFEHVERYALPFRTDTVKVPLTRSHAHDLERMRAATRGDRPSLVFICNPNNPTGGLTSCDELEGWIRSAPEHVLFLVDEAYFEFVTDAGYRTMLPHIAERKNVIVARTFSKVYGLAGLRLGYALAHSETAAAIRQFTQFSNLNQLALAAALAALPDQPFVQRSLASNAAARKLVETALDDLGIEHLPSHTNFVMHRIQGDLAAYIERMRSRQILVGRPFPPMTQYNRVSLGTPEEMAVWAEAVRDFRKQGWI